MAGETVPPQNDTHGGGCRQGQDPTTRAACSSGQSWTRSVQIGRSADGVARYPSALISLAGLTTDQRADDPITAVQAIDRIYDGLQQLCFRRIPNGHTETKTVSCGC
jgi:hypothetical protein